MREYTVVYEQGTGGGWEAYVPDLPGLGVLGDTFEETEQLLREAIDFHLKGLREYGEPIPEPTTRAARIAVAV